MDDNYLKIGELYKVKYTQDATELVGIYEISLFNVKSLSELREYVSKYFESWYMNDDEIFLILDIINFIPPDPDKHYRNGECWVKILRLEDNKIYTMSLNLNDPEKRFDKL